MEWTYKDEAFEIRAIAANDAELIYRYFQSFSEATRYFFTPHALDKDFAKKLTSEDLANPDTRRYVVTTRIEGEEVAVGYFFFWEWKKRVPWFGIGVKDGYQGRGIGSKMMEYAIREAERSRKGGILLITKKDNENAQALYRKYGYEIIGEEPNGQYLLLLNFNTEDSTIET